MPTFLADDARLPADAQHHQHLVSAAGRSGRSSGNGRCSGDPHDARHHQREGDGEPAPSSEKVSASAPRATVPVANSAPAVGEARPRVTLGEQRGRPLEQCRQQQRERRRTGIERSKLVMR